MHWRLLRPRFRHHQRKHLRCLQLAFPAAPSFPSTTSSTPPADDSAKWRSSVTNQSRFTSLAALTPTLAPSQSTFTSILGSTSFISSTRTQPAIATAVARSMSTMDTSNETKDAELQPICIPVHMVSAEAATEANDNANASQGNDASSPTKKTCLVDQYQAFIAANQNNEIAQQMKDERTNEPTILPVDFAMMLTEQEQDLLHVLHETAKSVQDGTLTVATRPDVKSITVRVAGGWVRDKIMGLPTHDVDVALDSCSGVEFAHLVQSWMEQYNKQHQQLDGQQPQADASERRLANSQHSRMGVIAANPSQSKHLETATMRVCGMEVDFNNLRHEAYSDVNSRIPTVAGIGTPYQDAMRRDFTMNALFLNVTQSRLEDWTRRGMNDLVHNKLVQTPLPPFQTFQDDPLRVLRAVRFGVRYRYRLDADLMAAAKDPSIHAELQRKVSRERVGKELEGMLSGKLAHPILALKTIYDLHLAPAVFLLPTMQTITTKAAATTIHGSIGIQSSVALPAVEDATTAPSPEASRFLENGAWLESKECLPLLSKVLERLHISSNVKCATQLDDRLVYLAAFLLPYFRSFYVNKKRKQVLVVEYMLRDGIKFKNKDSIGIVKIMQSVDAMAQLLMQGDGQSMSSTDAMEVDLASMSEPMRQLRLDAGLLLRETRELWLTTLVTAAVLALRHQPDDDEAILDRFQSLLETIAQRLQLDTCWKVRPMLDGKTIMAEVGIPRGPEVGEYNQEQVRWSLQYPSGTRDDAIQHLLAFKTSRQSSDSKSTSTGEEPKTKKMHL